MPNGKDKLTPKQKKFVEEYLVDLNATQAAIRAGYSKKTAKEQGYRLLTNIHIESAVQETRNKDSENCGITREKWLNELALCGFSDITNYLSVDPDTGTTKAKGFEDMPKETPRAIKKIKEKRVIKESNDGQSVILDSTFEFELYSKLQALDLIGKHLGFFVEKPAESSEEAGGLIGGVDSANL